MDIKDDPVLQRILAPVPSPFPATSRDRKAMVFRIKRTARDLETTIRQLDRGALLHLLPPKEHLTQAVATLRDIGSLYSRKITVTHRKTCTAAAIYLSARYHLSPAAIADKLSLINKSGFTANQISIILLKHKRGRRAAERKVARSLRKTRR